MPTTTTIIRRVLTVLLGLSLMGVLFLWLAAHATGHRIPAETDTYFAVMTIGLIIFIVLTRRFIRSKAVSKNSKA
jgi:O-antigen ligase